MIRWLTCREIDVREVAEALVDVEAVADEELIRDGETHVANR
jgi:hypothetical protein